MDATNRPARLATNRAQRESSRSSWTATAAGRSRTASTVAEGHRDGTRALRRTVEAAIDLGIETLAVYAFSTENWSRPADEVADLMEILSETIDRELPDLAKQGVRTRFLGRRDRIEPWLQEKMAHARAETAHLDTLDLWIAFDYGGRAEIVEAARRLVEDGVERRRRRRGRARRAALRARARARSTCSIRTSGELRHLELHALGDGVRRARLHRHAVARLRRRRPPRAPSRSSPRAAALRGAHAP